MGLFTRDIKTMDDLFMHTLQDIYYAEHQITKALPKMIKKATDPQLRQAFQTHLSETENQIKRLDQVFQMHGQKPKGVTCEAIDGIIDEARASSATSPTRRYWMPPCCRRLRRWSTMKSRATALLRPGPKALAAAIARVCSIRRSTRRGPPTRS